MALVITTYIFITLALLLHLEASVKQICMNVFSPWSKIICKFCNFQKLLQKFHVNIYDFLLPIFKILQRFLLHGDIPCHLFTLNIFSYSIQTPVHCPYTASSLQVELFHGFFSSQEAYYLQDLM